MVKKAVASASSGDGPVAASTIAPQPASAASRPSPVMTSTPVDRDIGTASKPRSRSSSTMWDPTRPVPPATAILRFMVCLLIVGLEG